MNSTVPRIQELRISFTRMQVFPELLPRDAKMHYLGNDIEYEEMFNKIQSNIEKRVHFTEHGEIQKPSLAPGELTVPWFKRHHFWEFYLDKPTRLSKVNGNKAWLHRVPLRFASPAKIPSSSLSLPLTHLTVDGYLYIHGVAVVLRATLKRDLPLDDMVNAACEVINHVRFEGVRWANGTTSLQPLTLKGLAIQTLGYLTKEVLNENTEGVGRLCDPFTVATVIRGNGLNLEQLQSEFNSFKENSSKESLNDTQGIQIKLLDSKIRRALEGLATWDTQWKYNAVHSDNKVTLKFKGQDTKPGYMLYGLKQSRVVWFPSYFMDTGETGELHLLGCYHSNLTIGSLQTSSLLELVRLFTDVDLSHHQLIKQTVRRAVVLLSNLYGQSDSSYRSWSLHKQIKDSGLIDEINKLRISCSISQGKPLS